MMTMRRGAPIECPTRSKSPLVVLTPVQVLSVTCRLATKATKITTDGFPSPNHNTANGRSAIDEIGRAKLSSGRKNRSAPRREPHGEAEERSHDAGNEKSGQQARSTGEQMFKQHPRHNEVPPGLDDARHGWDQHGGKLAAGREQLPDPGDDDERQSKLQSVEQLAPEPGL